MSSLPSGIMQGFNPFDPQRLQAAVNQEGNWLNAQTQQQGNQLNRQSAWERNFVDHDLGLKGNETNRYGIDTGRSNLLDQIASSDRQFNQGDATNRFGIQANYDQNLLSSLSNLAGNKYGSDRAAQASLGSAAMGAQANMLAPMLQQQRFMSLAPYVTGVLGSLGRGMGGQGGQMGQQQMPTPPAQMPAQPGQLTPPTRQITPQMNPVFGHQTAGGMSALGSAIMGGR